MRKTVISAIAIAAAGMCASTASAQTKMIIHKADNTTIEVNVADIENVTFEEATQEKPMYVDLGLPSGTLWATCNLGAESEDEAGYYLAWGELAPHAPGEAYTEDDYSDYYFDEMPGDIQNTEYDAAKAILGDGWMIPTAEQQGELAHTCDLYYEEINGHPCVRFVGPNGNSIVLPMAGRIQASPEPAEVGSLGMYWSSDIFRMNPEGAYVLWCRQSSEDPTKGGCDAGTGSGEHYFVATTRCSGLSVRAIYVP